MVLPGRAAARVRKAAADIMVRYQGGEPQLVEEVAANRLRQKEMDEDDPQRLFGQTVESEALKRKREEVILVELEGRVKRARVQAATDVARLTLGALQDLGLRTSDRDRMLCKDMITTAAFTQPGQGQLGGGRGRQGHMPAAVLRHKGQEGLRGGPWEESQEALPGGPPRIRIPKKTIFAQGQMVEANRWTASMVAYLERAIQAL